MALVVESTSFQATATVDSITVTKPSGVAVGDLLLAVFNDMNNDATCSGFTSIYSAIYDGPGGISDSGLRVLAKIADSGDVAASNYTFISGNTSDWLGIVTMLRVSGWISSLTPNPVFQSSYGGYNPTTNGTFSQTGLTLKRNGQNLLLMVGTGLAVVSNESLTFPSPAATVTSGGSNPTWTTINNSSVTVNTAATSTVSLWVAYATTTETSDITAYQHAYTSSGTDNDMGAIGALLVINEPTNVTPDLSHLAVTPTIESITVSQVNVAPTVSHLDTLPTVHGAEVIATAPTVWTNEANESTIWTNESL